MTDRKATAVLPSGDASDWIEAPLAPTTYVATASAVMRMRLASVSE